MKFVNAPSRARRIIKKNDTILSTVRTYLRAIAFVDEKNGYLQNSGNLRFLFNYLNLNI